MRTCSFYLISIQSPTVIVNLKERWRVKAELIDSLSSPGQGMPGRSGVPGKTVRKTQSQKISVAFLLRPPSRGWKNEMKVTLQPNEQHALQIKIRHTRMCDY